MTFQQWLDSKSIDIQSLEPEMARSLRSRFEAEQEPPASVLVVPSDCLWPARAIWQPVH